ncbi:MAG: hypothetical protein US57_C0011G0037 [Candidatus Moranbacteria bacterium GW2011_GWC2_37_73]|nr:MAG: hypothetical protein UR95_C0006G0142 [Parcubacteria group bacterium GW2011_GWC1_36_108]KKQ00012.1 MAG: hypothetical protein US09_C0025G0004 [Candidatus Moranbacteria bacterium GW2011_GWD1_36_198]KKQ00377.1 MAG: hypothetical protein US10_C0033G0004 [Candidatus Moranbacteria bacterium GW2011_GWD2_36_198]KKQ39549.1 MAG: hypothetical protein US57_C0011G0037 [Candidatus Moranbacteria bacterium GW2011_GWC2_37_73]HAS00184.1 hypothetical protein [Candidatus Moranbacteria bacterium]
MNYKKKIYWILFASVILIVMGFALALPEIFGLCKRTDASCIDEYIYSHDILSTLLIFFAVPIFIISFIMLFLREQIFDAWLKFAIIFAPSSIIFIAISSPQGDMFFPSIRELAIFLLPVIFLISSFGIIFWESRKAKKW